MKKILITLIFVFTISNIYSQRKLHVVPYYNWSCPIAYQISPSPIVSGYGVLSDSLSKAHNDSTFYECNGKYYPIESWADYYYWYVNKYWWQFKQPELYEYFYWTEDDYGMTQYICGANYYGASYPSRIAVTFPGKEVYINNLSKYRIKKNIKSNSWTNKYYIADRTAENVKRNKTSSINERTYGKYQKKDVSSARHPVYSNSREYRTNQRSNYGSREYNTFSKTSSIFSSRIPTSPSSMRGTRSIAKPSSSSSSRTLSSSSSSTSRQSTSTSTGRSSSSVRGTSGNSSSANSAR